MQAPFGDGTYDHICVCTLIGQRFALTAASCVLGPKQPTAVVFNQKKLATDFPAPAVGVDILRWTVVADANGIQDDLAVLELVADVTTISPITVVASPNDKTDRNSLVHVAGWVSRTPMPAFTSLMTTLRQQDVRIRDLGDCAGITDPPPAQQPNSKNLCARMTGIESPEETPEGQECNGEVGAPIFYRRSGQDFQIGVVTRREGCALTQYGVLGTRVYQHYGFIDGIVGFPTTSPTPAPSVSPTYSPSASPSASPTLSPSTAPTISPTRAPTVTIRSTSAPTTLVGAEPVAQPGGEVPSPDQSEGPFDAIPGGVATVSIAGAVLVIGSGALLYTSMGRTKGVKRLSNSSFHAGGRTSGGGGYSGGSGDGDDASPGPGLLGAPTPTSLSAPPAKGPSMPASWGAPASHPGGDGAMHRMEEGHSTAPPTEGKSAGRWSRAVGNTLGRVSGGVKLPFAAIHAGGAAALRSSTTATSAPASARPQRGGTKPPPPPSAQTKPSAQAAQPRGKEKSHVERNSDAWEQVDQEPRPPSAKVDRHRSKHSERLRSAVGRRTRIQSGVSKHSERLRNASRKSGASSVSGVSGPSQVSSFNPRASTVI